MSIARCSGGRNADAHEYLAVDTAHWLENKANVRVARTPRARRGMRGRWRMACCTGQSRARSRRTYGPVALETIIV